MQVRLDNVTPMAERIARQAAAREFLWSHWRARQPASLGLAQISKEGKHTDFKFDINSGPGSTFMLHISTTQYRYGYNGQVLKLEESGADVYTVERVLASKTCFLEANVKVQPIANDVTLSGSDYCLQFKGWDDSIEGWF